MGQKGFSAVGSLFSDRLLGTSGTVVLWKCNHNTTVSHEVVEKIHFINDYGKSIESPML